MTARLLLRLPLLWLALISLGFLAFARSYSTTRNSGAAWGAVILTTAKRQVTVLSYPGLHSALDGWNITLSGDDVRRAAPPTGYRVTPLSGPGPVVIQRRLTLSYDQIIAFTAATFALLIGFQLLRGSARERALHRLLASQAKQPDDPAAP